MEIRNKRFAFILCLQLSAAACLAQDIKGNVVDKKTQEPIIGATVEAVGTGKRTVTDVDGNFDLKGLKKGAKYTITVKYISYKTQNIDGVQAMSDGAGNPIKIALSADEQQLGEVTVTGVERKNTDVATIQAAKSSSVIVSNVRHKRFSGRRIVTQER